MEELFSRIRSVLRRPTDPCAEAIEAGALVFDVADDEPNVAGVRLLLLRRGLRVLATLVSAVAARFARIV